MYRKGTAFGNLWNDKRMIYRELSSWFRTRKAVFIQKSSHLFTFLLFHLFTFLCSRISQNHFETAPSYWYSSHSYCWVHISGGTSRILLSCSATMARHERLSIYRSRSWWSWDSPSSSLASSTRDTPSDTRRICIPRQASEPSEVSWEWFSLGVRVVDSHWHRISDCFLSWISFRILVSRSSSSEPSDSSGRSMTPIRTLRSVEWHDNSPIWVLFQLQQWGLHLLRLKYQGRWERIQAVQDILAKKNTGVNRKNVQNVALLISKRMVRIRVIHRNWSVRNVCFVSWNDPKENKKNSCGQILLLKNISLKDTLFVSSQITRIYQRIGYAEISSIDSISMRYTRTAPWFIMSPSLTSYDVRPEGAILQNASIRWSQCDTWEGWAIHARKRFLWNDKRTVDSELSGWWSIST